jgi:hypothetical protein
MFQEKVKPELHGAKADAIVGAAGAVVTPSKVTLIVGQELKSLSTPFTE